MQLIRERVELQRAVKLPWLADLAASTAKALGGSPTAAASSNGATPPEVTSLPMAWESPAHLVTGHNAGGISMPCPWHTSSN